MRRVSMSFLIRKAILLLVIGLAIVGGWVLYHYPGIVRPMFIWAGDTWRHLRSDGRIDGTLRGQVVEVFDARTLTERADEGGLYNLRLIGILPPEPGVAGVAPDTAIAATARRLLGQMALGQPVRVDLVHLATNRTGLGGIYVGETNLGVAMVDAGLATTDPKTIDRLPAAVQAELLKAERRSQMQHHGLWRNR